MRHLRIAAAALSSMGIALGMGSAAGAMDMDHGHGAAGKHGKNAPVVKGARKISVVAESYTFTPAEISVEAGEDVTIVLQSSDVLHDFVVKGEGHIVSAKGEKTVRGGLALNKPGAYKFWCSVSGHRAEGMKGTITVTAT